MGRRSFNQIDGENGWVFPGGATPDWPVIVLQSQARAPVKKGKTHSYFVTDGIQSAIAKAQGLAGEKNVALHAPRVIFQDRRARTIARLSMMAALTG